MPLLMDLLSYLLLLGVVVGGVVALSRGLHPDVLPEGVNVLGRVEVGGLTAFSWPTPAAPWLLQATAGVDCAGALLRRPSSARSPQLPAALQHSPFPVSQASLCCALPLQGLLSAALDAANATLGQVAALGKVLEEIQGIVESDVNATGALLGRGAAGPQGHACMWEMLDMCPVLAATASAYPQP